MEIIHIIIETITLCLFVQMQKLTEQTNAQLEALQQEKEG